jgi:hypothetical protein
VTSGALLKLPLQEKKKQRIWLHFKIELQQTQENTQNRKKYKTDAEEPGEPFHRVSMAGVGVTTRGGGGTDQCAVASSLFHGVPVRSRLLWGQVRLYVQHTKFFNNIANCTGKKQYIATIA